MRLFGVCSAIILMASLLRAYGQTPEDQYVRIYSLIDDADRLNSSGEARAAINKYTEAQGAIKELQRLYPNWNERIVSYRLDYIAGKLEPLTRANAPAANVSPKGSPKPVLGPAEMQQELAQLTAQNELLEAKLREALRVQPAAADPRELGRAQERINALQKERDVLVITLEQIREKQAPVADSNGSGGNGGAAALREKNEELQKRIVELETRLERGLVKENLSFKELVAALQASNRVMKAEQLQMEQRMMELVTSYGSVTRGAENERELQLIEARTALAAAQKERAELVQRLESLTKQPEQNAAKPRTAASDENAKQIEAIQARLEVFEAKKLPYTSEELVLFKQPPIPVAASQTNGSPATLTRKAGELPPGAGPLMREAERAIDAGRFPEAEQKLRDVLRQDDSHPYVLAKLAAVQMDQEKTSEAEVSLTKALQSAPEDPASLYLLGSVRIRQEKYDEAVGLLSRAVKLVPDNAQAHYFLGKALIQQGQRGPAETELRKAIQLRPGWGDAHYLLAVIYSTQDSKFKDLGQYHYKKAIAGGSPRNLDLERWMEKNSSTTRP